MSKSCFRKHKFGKTCVYRDPQGLATLLASIKDLKSRKIISVPPISLHTEQKDIDSNHSILVETLVCEHLKFY